MLEPTSLPASSLPARNRKPRGQGASRRGEILAAASRIFLEEGVAQTTMRRIAAAVGVSPTALYVYFADKNAILAAIASAWFADLLAALEASQKAQDSAEARLRAGLRTYVDFGVARPDAYRLTFLAKQATKGELKPCEDIPEADHSFAILINGVAQMIAEGRFRPGHPEQIAETIWAALHGLTSLLIDHPEQLETPTEVMIGLMLDMVVGGFR